MSNVILEVKDLKTKYVTRQKEAVYAVDGVSLQIEDGKILGVAGESGCGKSTLATIFHLCITSAATSLWMARISPG